MRRTILRFVTLSLIMSSVGPFLGGSALGQEIKSIWVAHRRVDCIGVVPQKCYLIKSHQYEDWRFWYSEIEGFEFEEGYAYELLVREVRVEDPPADAPAVKLELVEVLLRVETYEKQDDPRPPPAPVAQAAAEPQTVEVEPTPAPPAPDEVVTPPATKKVETTPPPAPQSAQPKPPAPSPKPVPVPAPSAPAPPATSPPPTASPLTPQPRAPQGQEVRGHLSIGAGIEARSFKVCGTKESIWVEDRTDSDLWDAYRQMAQFPNRPLFMIVRGELQAPPPSGY